MATRKKAKAKRSKKPIKKTTVRRKVGTVRKTVDKRKVAKKKVAKKTVVKKSVVKRKPRQAVKPLAAPAPAPLAGEERIGIVTHYYGDLSVAAVTLESGGLRVGDTIHVVGHTSDFRQRVESMQLEHESVAQAAPGQEIGLKVTAHAREHDVVYKAAA